MKEGVGRWGLCVGGRSRQDRNRKVEEDDDDEEDNGGHSLIKFSQAGQNKSTS